MNDQDSFVLLDFIVLVVILAGLLTMGYVS